MQPPRPRLQTYTDGIQSVSTLLDTASGWDRARQALTNLRSMVKQYLMPSLNAVASLYLVQMTGCERSVIHADNDLAITMDDQAATTRSGSGKAVACLALRLGLEQVFTQGVFPVFIGNEVDANMDQNRIANTDACRTASRAGWAKSFWSRTRGQRRIMWWRWDE